MSIDGFRNPLTSTITNTILSIFTISRFINTRDLTNHPVFQVEVGTAIISTSAGIVSHIKAQKLKKGGEILCYVG